jgi:hypothetical protein
MNEIKVQKEEVRLATQKLALEKNKNWILRKMKKKLKKLKIKIKRY